MDEYTVGVEEEWEATLESGRPWAGEMAHCEGDVLSRGPESLSIQIRRFIAAYDARSRGTQDLLLCLIKSLV